MLRELGAFPGLVGDGAHAVEGEVYEVDAEIAAALERLEGYPRFYRRITITLEDGAAVETYLIPPQRVAGRPVITLGSWRARRQKRRP